MRMKRDTLKTLERATHIHRPYFHPDLRFILYRSHLYHSIKFNSLYSILFINKVHFYLPETVYIVVFYRYRSLYHLSSLDQTPDHYQILSVDFRFYILAPTVGKINEKHLC